MKTPVILLGKVSATFSSDAYVKLAAMFGAPALSDETVQIVSVERNGEVLQTLLEYPNGYGVIAMETRAEGRVAEPLESFIDLLAQCPEGCSLNVVGSIKMKINFALMVRPGVKMEDIKGIIAHPKALGACRKRIQALGLPIEESANNGKAAEDVAMAEKYSLWAALGPESAAWMYGLEILIDGFEDKEAVTTFFLLAPISKPVFMGEKNRALIVYQLSHIPNSLVNSLIPFGDEGLNLIQIHSMHVGNGNYSFAIELDCPKADIEAFGRAVKCMQKHVVRSIVFGPFEVREG